jgi:hypothetical protein
VNAKQAQEVLRQYLIDSRPFLRGAAVFLRGKLEGDPSTALLHEIQMEFAARDGTGQGRRRDKGGADSEFVSKPAQGIKWIDSENGQEKAGKSFWSAFQ